MSVQHVVLLGFAPELDSAGEEEMKAQVRAWPKEIGGFERVAIGAPISTDRTRGYHFLLTIVVPDEEALQRYLVHPVHQRFARWVADQGGTVLAFDYALDATTLVTLGGE